MSIAAMNWAWQLRSKPTIKLVLMALADAADDRGYCWPSIPTLANKTCMDERSVQRILKNLRDNNYIVVQARFRIDGSPTSNKYRLAMQNTSDKLSPPRCQETPEEVTARPSHGGNTVPQTTTEPLINQKQPLQQPIDHENSSNTDYYSDLLILPQQLTPPERQRAITLLAEVSPSVAQEILDELTARLNNNSITSSLGYIRSLIRRAKSENFIPEAGLKIAYLREQKLKQLETAKKSTEDSQPSPSEIKKHLSVIHEIIGHPLNDNSQLHHTPSV